MLLFYTDSLADSFYKDAPDEFLMDMQQIITSMKDESSEEILSTILKHMYNFDEDAKYTNDDVSMILCKM